ncbi:response regulator [Opitutus sp. ER46]|uniref:response regulator n=1 Tax=Opitutus sp. ER46 TaxID=2161864 RepID=UPI000D31B602|nr:response regulator [Opitutus sp. ER46]PTX94282.1 hypothetical protein DB354_10995 [Opitutus sp. ER46]
MNFPDPTLPPIVIVDDCQDDVFQLRHLLRTGGIANPVTTFDCCAAAQSGLQSAAVLGVLPARLFIDIRMDGARELIAGLRHNPRYDDVRVIVATYSNDADDIAMARHLRIDGYLMKFPEAGILAHYVRHGPWFTLPQRGEAAGETVNAASRHTRFGWRHVATAPRSPSRPARAAISHLSGLVPVP